MVLLDPPSRIFPLLTNAAAWSKRSKQKCSKDHDTPFEDHEDDLVIREFAVEPMSKLCDTEAGAD